MTPSRNKLAGQALAGLLLRRTVILLTAVAGAATAHAFTEPQRPLNPEILPARPDAERCTVTADPDWRDTEKWVWDQICTGDIADFNRDLGELSSKSAEGWNNSERGLSAKFLETILLHDPYRSALPRQGFRVVGAYFDEPLELVNADFQHELSIEQSRFEEIVDLRSLRTTEDISLEGSTFEKRLNLDKVEAQGSLLLRCDTQFSDLIISGAEIQIDVNLIESTVLGILSLDAIDVGSRILLRGSTFHQDVSLLGAKVGDQVDAQDAVFGGNLIFNSASVGGDILLRRIGAQKNPSAFGENELIILDFDSADIGGNVEITKAILSNDLTMDSMKVGNDLILRGSDFQELNLLGANVGDQVDIRSAFVGGPLTMDFIDVGGSVLLLDSQFGGDIKLAFSNIGSSLNLSGARLRRLDMTGARIGSEFIIGSEVTAAPAPNEKLVEISQCGTKIAENPNKQTADSPNENDPTGDGIDEATELKTVQWQSPARLVLRNASVGAFRDLSNSWDAPEGVDPREFITLDLDGFDYGQLGGFGESVSPIRERGPNWYKVFLDNHRPFSPQPYRQLANVFSQNGFVSEANSILAAGRDRDRTSTDSLMRATGLFLLKIFIGYGYGVRYFISLVWVAGFVLLGMIVLRTSDENKRQKERLGFWYSLDMLLPVIHLRDKHYEDIDLVTWAKDYFYVHKIMGYILGFFIVAGLSGLTQ